MPEQPHSTWNREESQPIAIPLLGAGSRSNVDPDHDDYGFIGRDGLISELLTTLDQTRNSRGCYLIAGFRGSGKTSLINKVLSRHADNSACYPAWVAFPADQSIPDYESVSPYLERGKKKIEEIIDQKSINDSSVPTTTRDPYATSFRKKMLDLLGRSLNYLHSRIRTFHFVRSFSPLIDVRVNLGHEKPLGSRDVLLNTATLLYQKLKRQPIETRVARWGTYLLLAALPTIAVYLFWWEPFLRWLYDWLPWSWMFPDTKKLLSPPWVGGLLTLIFIRYLWIRHLPTYDRILFRMKQLHGKMAYANEYSSVLGKSGISLSRRRNAAPIDEREIEMELLDILEDCRGVFPLFVRPDIIFVFDELDKISPDGADESGESSGIPSVDRDSRERKKKVDQLLGALKNFITHGQARFFFIAGREMLDSYYAERASTSSLYESLFNRTFEVPSLLSDRSNRNHLRIHSMIEAFVCRKLLSRDVAIYLWLLHAHQSRNNDPSWETDLRRKLTYSPFCLRTYYHYLCLVPGMEGKEARRIVLGLRNFVQFLTLHSWGNPKRLILLFEHFTKPMSDVDWRQRKQARHIAGLGSTAPLALQFGVMDQQRIILASNLYTQIYHAMGRQLARSSDKLIVSTFAAFQYILKFHRHPFSRNSLERIAESLDIYRPAELNTLVDALLSKVLRPQVRLIRNSHYRYRFDSSFEEEMRYISRVSDIESAAFNFTLDSAAAIKAFFRLELREMEKQDGTLANKSAVGIAGLCGILGDLLAQEQSDGQALSYYQKAVDVIDQCEPSVRRRIAHIQVEALLRLGELYERRQRYNRAASVYLHARKIVRDLERHSDDYAMLGAMRRGDSKWDIFRQPFWAYWFLQLKRSPMPARDALPLTGFEYPFSPGSGDAVNHYRAGQLAFYYGCHCAAVSSFLLAIGSSNQSTETSERTVHRRAYAYLNLGENLLVGLMRYGNDLRDRDGFSVVVERLDSGDKINKLEELVKKFEDGEAGYINKLRAVRSETADPENRQYLVNNFNGTLTFGMMAHAAKMLSDAGMYYHAALAYMKIIATWGMICELMSVHQAVSGNSVSMPDKLASAEWIADVRDRAEKNITKMNAGGYTRFLTRWRKRDVKSFFQAGDEKAFDETLNVQQSGRGETPLSTKLQAERTTIIKLARSEGVQNQIREQKFLNNRDMGEETLNVMFPRQALGLIDEEVTQRIVEEAFFMQRSMPGQELVYLSTWEWLTRARLTNGPMPVAVPHNSMIPHSVHHLIFSHWLTGRRYLYWSVKDVLQRLSSSCAVSYSPIEDETAAVSYSPIQNEMERRSILSEYIARSHTYDDAAAAIHNFHLAFYYSRQLSSNDQDIMFPPPAMILFDLWCLLYSLVKFETDRQGATSYDEVTRRVADELSESKSRRHGTPANCYEFKNTTLRTISALLETEHLSDITNRARSDILKTRQYLADDFEDPRFHLDWTLAQMYAPIAKKLRQYVEEESEAFEKRVSTFGPQSNDVASMA